MEWEVIIHSLLRPYEEKYFHYTFKIKVINSFLFFKNKYSPCIAGSKNNPNRATFCKESQIENFRTLLMEVLEHTGRKD